MKGRKRLMIMKKRVTYQMLAVLAAAVLCVGMLAACGGGGSSTQNASSDNDGQQQAVQQQSENNVADDVSTASDAASGDATVSEADAEDSGQESQGADSSLFAGRYKQNGEYRDCLVTTDGIPIVPEIEGADPDYIDIRGQFTEGLAFVEWVTYDYDTEWNEETNIQAHLGCLDSTGRLALDLSSLIPDSLRNKQNLSRAYLLKNGPCFSDGYAILAFADDRSGDLSTVKWIDKTGAEKWSKNIHSTLDDEFQLQDDMVRIQGTIYNSAGDACYEFSERSSYDDCHNVSNGFVCDGRVIKNYADQIIIGEDFVPEGYSRLMWMDSWGYGFVGMIVDEDSPNGTGNTRRLGGVWSLADMKWAVEPIPNASFDICGPDLFVCEIYENSSYSYRFFNAQGAEYSLASNFPTIWEESQNWSKLDNNWYLGNRSEMMCIHFSGDTMDAYTVVDLDNISV